MKKLFKDPSVTGALGIFLGVSLTRIIDGGNALGAVAAGAVIGLIIWVLFNIIFAGKKEV